MLYQIGALYGFCRGHQVELQHVKPHGALYNQAAAAPDLARAIARAVARFSRDLPLVGLASSSAFAEAASEAGVPFVAEAFADRRYNPDGSLQSRAIAGSLLTDPTEAAQQALRLTCDGVVQAHDGTLVQVHATDPVPPHPARVVVHPARPNPAHRAPEIAYPGKGASGTLIKKELVP